MLDTLLKNEFLVMAVDVLLHLGSVAVLGVVVLLSAKLLSRGFVDAKLFTGLIIATLLVIVRVTLLNYVGQALPTVGGQLLEIIVIIGLYLSAFILVYKLILIPVLGTALSAAVIVFAQLSLANYTPKISLKIMPEGQRFAEYAGLANDQTKKLMADAKAYRSTSGGIQQILADAMEAIKFFTSETEQGQLSKDFASGIALYKERKAYMDNMTPEELASYRIAMGAFLEEQGLKENRYSLSNLKNAKPEDLENLADFMKDMNKVYGLTDELPEDGGASLPKDAPPPSMESLAAMAQSLSKVDMSGTDMAKLSGLFTELGINADAVMAGMAQAREDLAGIRDVTQNMVSDFKALVPDELLNFPEVPGRDSLFAGSSQISDDEVIVSGGYRIKKIAEGPAYSSSLFSGDLEEGATPAMVNDEVAYFMPSSGMMIPNEGEELDFDLNQPAPETMPEEAVETNYFEAEELSPITTEQSVVLIPSDLEEKALWRDVSTSIRIDAWFSASDEASKSTIFIAGAALQDGDILEHKQDNQVYRFEFRGIEENLITLVALERTPAVE